MSGPTDPTRGPASDAPAAPGLFPATRWSLIRSARASDEARRVALETLLGMYWRPLYIFIRKRGLDAAQARDAVQDLMVQLLERDWISRAQAAKGKLRSYLMAAASNSLANRHAAQVSQRRGGGAPSQPLDFVLAERIASEDSRDPDAAFDREWALGVMDRAVEKLKAEYASGERAGPAELLLQFVRPDGAEPPSYAAAAAAHGMSVPQLKSFLHRARGRFRALVEAEIAETVEPEDVAEELAHLVEVLRR